MTDQELKDIVSAVVAELEKSGVDFDYKADQAKDDDLVFVIRGTAPDYQGVTVTWKGLLDIITAQATQAKTDAETAKNAANTILEQVQSKGTEITNFVATSKTEIETQKNESVNAVKSVYQSDLNELKGDLDNKLPKSPVNWELWTDEEQATARERMGIPGDYELIEEITVTEDIQKIERFYDLEGNMYAFRSILLISEFPKAAEGRDKIENYRVTAKLNNNKYIDAFTTYNLNAFENSTYQLIQNQNGFYNMVFSECISNKGYLNGYPAKISSSFVLGDYIKSVNIETTLSANIYSGTVIKIYGVRA